MQLGTKRIVRHKTTVRNNTSVLPLSKIPSKQKMYEILLVFIDYISLFYVRKCMKRADYARPNMHCVTTYHTCLRNSLCRIISQNYILVAISNKN